MMIGIALMRICEVKMNRQRQIVVTVTYNDLGIIVDAKAEPREKGKWILQTDPNSKFYNWYRCSNCGAIIGDPTSNFCSECGCDMRGDTE